MNDSLRYIMAIVIAMIILFTWQILFPVEQPNYQQENGQEALLDDPSIPEVSNIIPVEVVSCESEKIIIDNDRLEGSIDLCGAQINEIFLKKFNTTASIDSDYVQLFKKDSYWVESGWLAPRGANFSLPDENTLWKLESQNSILSPNTPVVISWENGNGLKFIQRFSIDENYLFTFTQEVENNTLGLITLFPFNKLSRKDLPSSQTLGLLHEGPTGWFDEKLDLIIDWGWFYFISKPLFYILDFLYIYTGNFGVAILLLTVLIKLVFFPVVNRSYVQMAKMRKVQPEIQKMKELYGDDRQKMAQEMQTLYKKEELKPLSGCLPVFIQIPVFFALYNVLLVTIEMRHAPFFGWIRDLSAPDPLSVFNLFGIIDWTPPQILMIGIFHLLFGLTFLLQTKLNPAPTDQIQKTLFTWMPIFMIFIAANFPIGLVIYWAWNGLLSILQQAYIMKKQGMEIALFANFGKKNSSE